MRVDFANAMRAVAKLTRSQKLVEATRMIQDALSGKEAASSQDHLQDHASPHKHRGEERPRKPLGQVIDSLVRVKRTLRPDPTARVTRVRVSVPAGAQFLSGTFSCASGSRDYRLYIPSLRGSEPPALLVMLHGCKQDPEDFAIGTDMNAVAQDKGMLVLYPAQAQSANTLSCWNWFNPKDQMRESGESAIIAGMTRQLIGTHGVDSGRVFVAGLSAGGAMAAVMGSAYPELYAAVGIHSGLAYKSASDVVTAFAAMRGEAVNSASPNGSMPIRTIVFHGDADKTVHPSNAGRIIETQFAAKGFTKQAMKTQGYTRVIITDEAGTLWGEHWDIHQAGHGWSGGNAEGSYTHPAGPKASNEMVRFFLSAGRPL